VKADEVTYTLTIETKDKSAGVYHKDIIPINVRVAGNWKLDVSTGAMFNLGLNDNAYHFDEVKADTFQLVQDEKRGNFFPTLGILTHVYRKSPNYVNWGVSFGLGLNDSQKLRYYLGMGLMLGESQRFILSGGLAASPVKVLMGKYKEGQVFNGSSFKPDTVTEDLYKVGWFISISYNLSSSLQSSKKKE